MFFRYVLSTIFIFQINLVQVFAQYRYDCHENFCKQNAYPCPNLDCKDGRIIKNATQCGCCHICVEQLKEGEACKTEVIAVFPQHECGPELICDQERKICVTANTECVRDRIKHDSRIKHGYLWNLKSRPDCDENGFYKSSVCESDVLCYCVDKYGNRIFGTDAAKNRYTMNCQCSRDFVSFHRPVPVGNFLRCLPNGNYDSLQCTEKWCYCMADSFHIVGTVVEANKTIKDLICYDKERHKYDDANLRSKCWNERNNLITQIKKYESRGVEVIGVDLPECDLDGSYAPVQCKKDRCFCVKKNGESYSNSKYQVRRNSKAAKEMNCKCIREKDLLSDYNEDAVKKFFNNNPCDINGNYRKLD